MIRTFPEGHDRLMVTEAYERGADVFLTMDRGIWRRDTIASVHGMRCLQPTALLDELHDAGIALTTRRPRTGPRAHECLDLGD